MIQKTKFISGLLIFLVLVAISGCMQQGKKDTGGDALSGTQGLVMQFVDNYPRNSYIIGSEEERIPILVDITNKGTYPVDAGNIYISGFDKTIVTFEEKSKALSELDLLGANSFNPMGGFDTAEFYGKITPNEEGKGIDRYETVILATVCYPYVTKASPSVCIDPYPFDTKMQKVCKVGSQTLTSQGAPVAITLIEEEAATNMIQFKIHIKNVGDGEIIKSESLGKCNPYGDGRLERDDFDIIELVAVKVSSEVLECGPFAGDTGNMVTLYNGEGFIICSLKKSQFGDLESAYATSLNVELKYGYKSVISKQIEISKLTDII
ncbi:MAG: hypothetical protein V1831_04445 [Candidatus Woesearchaeota archaeon]